MRWDPRRRLWHRGGAGLGFWKRGIGHTVRAEDLQPPGCHGGCGASEHFARRGPATPRMSGGCWASGGAGLVGGSLGRGGPAIPWCRGCRASGGAGLARGSLGEVLGCRAVVGLAAAAAVGPLPAAGKGRSWTWRRCASSSCPLSWSWPSMRTASRIAVGLDSDGQVVLALFGSPWSQRSGASALR